MKKANINILYEDKDVVAVDKPAGLLVHDDGRGKEKTLVDWFVAKYPRSKNIGEDIVLEGGKKIKRSGVLHRLDKETSGVVLLAKTKAGFENLKDQFQNHTIKKTYHTFIYGTPKNPRGVMDRPIGRSSIDFRKKSTDMGARGHVREAKTNYMIKESASGYSYAFAMPETGRTHQIRVHFKSIGHPIVADTLYAGEHSKSMNNLGFKRVALHSFNISFQNTKGEIVKVEAPEPKDFQIALKLLRK